MNNLITEYYYSLFYDCFLYDLNILYSNLNMNKIDRKTLYFKIVKRKKKKIINLTNTLIN